MRVDLNRRAIGEFIRGEQIRESLRTVAKSVESSAKGHPAVVRHEAEVSLEDYTTDRAVVAVMLNHPVGVGIEGKYGVLTRGASAASTE